MKKMKKYNIKTLFKTILKDINIKYIDQIRGENPSFFIRNRKVSPRLIFLQMVSNTAKSFKNELENFYYNLSKPKDVSTWGFTKQRLKFSPKSILTIAQDYLKSFYDKSGRAIKLLDYYVFAIDGSDFTVPSTEENKRVFGIHKGPKGTHPAMGKLSTIYDCLNKMIIDIQVNIYKYAESKSAEANLNEMRNLFGQAKKKIIIFDRGYPSIKLIMNLLDYKEKFLFRLKSSDFKIERRSMTSNDDWIDISFDRVRLNQYRTDYYFIERLLKLRSIKLRFVSIPLTTPDGEIIEEYLLTNLDNNEFDLEGLKYLYHLRWNVETSYRMLKSNLKLENFSGLKSTIVYQDIYMSVFVFNLTQDIISHTYQKHKIDQEKYKYKMRINTNYAIGAIKSCFIRLVAEKNNKKGDILMNDLIKRISCNLVPIRDGRHYLRNITPVNKCRMSYKYSY